MISALILALIGVVILVATRHYVREPVLRTIGVIVGAACLICGVALVIIALIHHLDTPTTTHLDSAPTLRLR